MPSRDGYVLAIDFGTRHIGVAVGQTITQTASGLTTIRANNGVPHWPDLVAIIDEYRPACIVVGLPLNMDDSESEMSQRARDFAKRLASRTDIRIEFVDERLTSREAKSQLHDGGGDAADNHELAAALIAESWLSAHPNMS
jgi:putative Holliday junction resolvase